MFALAGQAKYVAGASSVDAEIGTAAGAAEAGELERVGTSAAKTATAEMTAIRRLVLESILPPLLVNNDKSRFIQK
jgi:hypothetical protein